MRTRQCRTSTPDRPRAGAAAGPTVRSAVPLLRLLAALALVLLGVTAVHGAGSPARAPGAVDHAASVCGGTTHHLHPQSCRNGDHARERAATPGHAQRPPDDTHDSAGEAAGADPAEGVHTGAAGADADRSGADITRHAGAATPAQWSGRTGEPTAAGGHGAPPASPTADESTPQRPRAPPAGRA